MRNLLLAYAHCAALTAAVWFSPPEVTEDPKPAAPTFDRMEIPANALVVLRAQPASTWESLDAALDVRVFEAGGRACLLAPPGEYKVVITAPDGSRKRLLLIAGKSPVVIPPPAGDPLAKELRDLYAAETSPTRSDDMKLLAALYAEMAEECASTDYQTAGQINAVFILARDKKLRATPTSPVRLETVRVRCGKEVASVIGASADTPITDALRASLRSAYTRLSAAVLEATK